MIQMVSFGTHFKVEILLSGHWLCTWPMSVQSMCWLGMKVGTECLMGLRLVNVERDRGG